LIKRAKPNKHFENQHAPSSTSFIASNSRRNITPLISFRANLKVKNDLKGNQEESLAFVQMQRY
jgi:hypothetical protein